jgi:hypothetical protein
VARDEPHVSVGACWAQAHFGEKAIFGEKNTKWEKDSWKEKKHVRGKHARHACKGNLTTLGLGFL